jgi:hypothetical protein
VTAENGEAGITTNVVASDSITRQVLRLRIVEVLLSTAWITVKLDLRDEATTQAFLFFPTRTAGEHLAIGRLARRAYKAHDGLNINTHS